MPFSCGLYYVVSDKSDPLKLPVILLHGAGGDHLSWLYPLRRLQGYRVIALDLPGHGNSEGLALQSVDQYADQLIEFMNSVGIYRAFLVGHSLGGAIALCMALRFPERVAAAGMIASSARFPNSEYILRLLEDPSQTTQALAFLENHLFAPTTRQDLISKVMKGLQQVKPEVLKGDWRAASDFDLRDELNHIFQPIWIANGEADRLTPPMSAYYLQKHLHHGMLQIIPAAGHMVILEHPGLLAKSLKTFLDCLPFRLGDL